MAHTPQGLSKPTRSGVGMIAQPLELHTEVSVGSVIDAKRLIKKLRCFDRHLVINRREQPVQRESAFKRRWAKPPKQCVRRVRGSFELVHVAVRSPPCLQTIHKSRPGCYSRIEDNRWVRHGFTLRSQCSVMTDALDKITARQSANGEYRKRVSIEPLGCNPTKRSDSPRIPATATLYFGPNVFGIWKQWCAASPEEISQACRDLAFQQLCGPNRFTRHRFDKTLPPDLIYCRQLDPNRERCLGICLNRPSNLSTLDAKRSNSPILRSEQTIVHRLGTDDGLNGR